MLQFLLFILLLINNNFSKEVSLKDMKKYLKTLETKNYRDPFLRKEEELWREFKSTLLPKLDGIIILENGKKLAIFNGEIFFEGEKVYNFTISKINKKGVFLKKGEKIYYIPYKLEP